MKMHGTNVKKKLHECSKMALTLALLQSPDILVIIVYCEQHMLRSYPPLCKIYTNHVQDEKLSSVIYVNSKINFPFSIKCSVQPY